MALGAAEPALRPALDALARGAGNPGGALRRRRFGPRRRTARCQARCRAGVTDKPARSTYFLDGRHVTDVDGFYCAVGEAINGPGGYFGWNTGAVDDCLRGSTSCSSTTGSMSKCDERLTPPHTHRLLIYWCHWSRCRAVSGALNADSTGPPLSTGGASDAVGRLLAGTGQGRSVAERADQAGEVPASLARSPAASWVARAPSAVVPATSAAPETVWATSPLLAAASVTVRVISRRRTSPSAGPPSAAGKGFRPVRAAWRKASVAPATRQ
jgi:barstar (barnase inhibitor)